MKKSIVFCGILAIACMFAACDKEKMEIKVSGVSISPTQAAAYELEVGGRKQFSASVSPSNADGDKEVVWSSSAPAVASVNETGEVTALANGDATITVKLKSDESVKASVRIASRTYENMSVLFDDLTFEALAKRFDTNNDGKLSKGEAAAVVELIIPSEGIESLEGLRYFTGLEVLDCEKNYISTLDLSANTNLKEVYCNNNRIEALDVTMLSELEALNCRANRMASIDVKRNPKLTYLKCGMNAGIAQVDVTENPLLEVLGVYYLDISELDVTRNPELRWLDMGYCCHTNWTATPIETVDLSNNPRLEYLNCVSSNYPGFGLNELDVTANPQLKFISTYGNPKITALDLSENTNLKSLNVSHNSISGLDVTACPLLDTLSCGWNGISVLDLSGSASLKYLDCANNSIGELDFSNTELGYLLAQNNSLTSLTMGKVFATIHPPVGGSSPGSISNQPYLYMKLNDNRLTGTLDLSDQENLHWLEIDNNQLSGLSVAGCAELGGLHCSDNLLETLDISGCTRLWELNCDGNKLQGTLDISECEGAWGDGLSRLAAEENELDYIKVRAGFNADATYYLGGVGSLPCYTKDETTQWQFAG